MPDAEKFAAQAKWRATHQKERWAHLALQSALNRGLIERKPCEVCADPATDGHHVNYDEPLNVRWLCRAHHKAEHRAAPRGRTSGGAPK